MATNYSNIDDILNPGTTATHASLIDAPSTDDGTIIEPPQDDYSEPDESQEDIDVPYGFASDGKEESREADSESQPETDEYGNKGTPDNEVIRDRLARQAESLNRKHQQEIDSLRAQLTVNQSQAVQQASKDFEYDPNAQGDWKQQLKDFVKQTVSETATEERQAALQYKEIQIQKEFETKFTQGMSKFTDFVDVVSGQPITDAMTIATRGMKDPAAFIYAASKRAPQELQRIANIPDQYAQMVEMGKLEERMRQTKPGTKAPKPMTRTQGDVVIKHEKARDPSIEDLIAKSDAKRIAAMKARRAR
jgi:hypothetical protein